MAKVHRLGDRRARRANPAAGTVHLRPRSSGRARFDVALWLTALLLVGIQAASGAEEPSSRAPAGVVDVNSSLTFEDVLGAGTGMVLSSKGLVLTNNHVVRGATIIEVRDVATTHTYPAKVLGYDVGADVALLQLQGASGLATVPLGDSAALGVGATVTAVGNAGGTGHAPSAAEGRVTALDRSITAVDELGGTSEQLRGLIEVKADVEPGDSGGPLVDARGRVVGMVTAASGAFSFQPGVERGFAIPINTAIAIANQIERGRFSALVHPGATALLGVDVEVVHRHRRPPPGGALVVGIVPASPAARIGLVPGDRITSLGRTAIASPGALTNALLADRPGEGATVGWLDPNGSRHSAKVVLASGPPE